MVESGYDYARSQHAIQHNILAASRDPLFLVLRVLIY